LSEHGVEIYDFKKEVVDKQNDRNNKLPQYLETTTKRFVHVTVLKTET